MADDITITPTPYTVLYDGVISRLKSYDFIKITEHEVQDILFDYIRPSIVRFKHCKQDLKNRDDNSKTFHIELTDEEIEILIRLMFIEYLSANYINVPSMLKSSLSSKDFNAFSPQAHLDKLIALRDTYKREVNQMISVYSYTNSRLFEVKTSEIIEG